MDHKKNYRLELGFVSSKLLSFRNAVIINDVAHFMFVITNSDVGPFSGLCDEFIKKYHKT